MSGNFDRDSNKVMYMFLIITVLLVGSIGYWVKTNGNYKTLVSTQGDFKIQVPKSWSVEIVEPNEFNPIYGIRSYDEATDSQVGVIVSPIAEGGNTTDDVKQLAQIYSLFGFTFAKEEDRTINGLEGRYYEATLSGLSGGYYQGGFVTYQNGKKYTLVMQVLNDNLETQKAHFEKGLNSFKIESNK